MDAATTIKNLLFIDNRQTYEELRQILSDEYNILIAKDMAAAEDILKHDKTEVSAFLIYANLQDDIHRAVEFIKDSNRLISIPILIYADENPPDRKSTRLNSSH